MSSQAWGPFAKAKDELLNAPFGRQQLIKERLFPSISQLSNLYEVPQSTLRSWFNKSNLECVPFDGIQRYDHDDAHKLIAEHSAKRTKKEQFK